MNPEQQQQQQSNHVHIICIASLLMCPFIVAFGFIYLFIVIIFFLGPSIYYEATIFNSDALAEKYKKEGVRLQGKVIARWKENEGSDHGPKFHVRVVYRVDQDRYVNNYTVVNRNLFSEQKLDLIRLPDYPKSAKLYVSFKGVDFDFPPSKVDLIVTAFVWMTSWNIALVIIILNSIEACDFCTNLVGPVLFGMIALELLVGYWVAKRNRDIHLKSTLYGAKRVVQRNHVNSWADDDVTPKYMSYSNFFDEGKHSCFSVTSSIVLDFITVVAWIIFAIYIFIFGGGYMIMYSLVEARWKYKILQRYESESTQVVGSIVCRQGHTNRAVIVQYNTQVVGSIVCRQGHTNRAVIVQYNVDALVYKKRLIVPSDMVVPDDPDLLYIMDNPASATLKCQVDNPQHERTKSRKNLYLGLCIMIMQVGGTILNGDPDGTQPFLLLAGILLACHIIFGFTCAWIHYEFVFKRELLWGAKYGVPRATENDEVLLDEEQELDIAVSLEPDWDELTQTTTDESVSTTETFVGIFMKGKKLFV